MRGSGGALALAAVVLVLGLGACARPTSGLTPGAAAPSAAPAGGGSTAGAASPGETGAAAAPAPRPKDTVVFAVPQRGVNYIVPTTAEVLGYFDEAGLDVKTEAMQSNLTIAAMQRGDVQITGSGGSSIRAAVRGAPFRLVAFMTAWPTYLLTMVPEIRSPAQLPGTRVGVNNLGGTLHYFFEMYAKEQRLEPSQITVVAMGPNQAQHLAAMQVGALDGAVLDPGTAAQAEKLGFHILKSLGEVAPAPQQGMVVTEEFLQKSPSAVQAFLKSLVRALLYVKQNPGEAAGILRRETGGEMDEALALRAVQLYAAAIWAEAPGYADEKLLDAFYEHDIRAPLELPPDQVIPAFHDFRLLLAAYDELGIPRPR